MRVKAAPGIQVPKEGKPREFITDDEAVEVPNSAYYLRIMTDGDLIDADAVASATKAAAVPADITEATPPAAIESVKTAAKKGGE